MCANDFNCFCSCYNRSRRLFALFGNVIHLDSESTSAKVV